MTDQYFFKPWNFICDQMYIYLILCKKIVYIRIEFWFDRAMVTLSIKREFGENPRLFRNCKFMPTKVGTS